MRGSPCLQAPTSPISWASQRAPGSRRRTSSHRSWASRPSSVLLNGAGNGHQDGANVGRLVRERHACGDQAVVFGALVVDEHTGQFDPHRMPFLTMGHRRVISASGSPPRARRGVTRSLDGSPPRRASPRTITPPRIPDGHLHEHTTSARLCAPCAVSPNPASSYTRTSAKDQRSRRSTDWLVIAAIRSKSLSTCNTVSLASSAVAAMSRSGIDGARCCPRSASSI